MALSFNCLLRSEQLIEADIQAIFERAEYYQKQPNTHLFHDLQGRVLATLFFEASTRTRFSFEKAMYRLGGHVISLEQGASSSTKKGESLSDMGRVMCEYADIVVMRHPQAHSVDEFSLFSTVPVINAGDGPNQHPTQSLVDLYTIFKEKGRLEDLNIAFMGDLKYGRTVHSLIRLLAHRNNTISCVSHKMLSIPDDLKQYLIQTGCSFSEYEELSDNRSELDVLYVTRVQQERFDTEEAYNKVRDLYTLKEHNLEPYPNVIVLHPLPRLNEIDSSVDALPCAKYFKQIEHSVAVRMALLSTMMDTDI